MTTSRTRFTASLAFGLLGIVAMAGCAGTVPAASPTSNKSPAPSPAATSTIGPAAAAPGTAAVACDVVTEQDATSALGADPGAGAAVVAAGASSCTFGHYPSMVTVNIIAQGGKADLAHIRSADTSGMLTNIAGLGDSAFGVANGPVASVWFSKGDTMVAIVVVGGSSGGPFLDQAKTVAAVALSRL